MKEKKKTEVPAFVCLSAVRPIETEIMVGHELFHDIVNERIKASPGILLLSFPDNPSTKSIKSFKSLMTDWTKKSGLKIKIQKLRECPKIFDCYIS